jgi:serine/threonine protein kinase
MLEAQLALEIKLQSYIDHPNILKMYGFFDDWQNVYIVLEYM